MIEVTSVSYKRELQFDAFARGGGYFHLITLIGSTYIFMYLPSMIFGKEL